MAGYTSHITGHLSNAADEFALGRWQTGLLALSGVLAYLTGATHSGWIILWAKRFRFHSSYALSMWMEALYLLLFGLLGVALSHIGSAMVPPTVLFLSFIMGMHNTVMTVLSGGAIRSTHMTGTVTDLGIELAKVLYYRRDTNPRLPDVKVNRPKNGAIYRHRCQLCDRRHHRRLGLPPDRLPFHPAGLRHAVYARLGSIGLRHPQPAALVSDAAGKTAAKRKAA